MDDLSRLATRMKPDKDYRRQHEPGIGYVCPRADGYGGREGVIPPGIAAQRGLIPKGMREVSNDAVSRRAREASAEGRPDAERYAEYYARGAQENAQRRPVAAPPPAPVTDPVPAPAAQTAWPAQPAARPTRAARPAAKPARKPVKSAAPKAPGVFPETENPVDGDDTLDGFYDELRGFGYGTGESEGKPRKRPAERAARPAGKRRPDLPDPRLPRVRGAEPEVDPEDTGDDLDAVPAPAPEPDYPADRQPDPDDQQPDPDASILEAVTKIAAERDDARRAYEELRRDYLVLQDRLNRQPKAPKPEAHDTVRIQLSAAPEKMKVGGRDVLGDVWEVRLLGHLDFSRDRTECVLTVIDPASGSELLAQLVPGEVMLLTKDGRTPCAYAGVCGKIYGDPGSSDFITCIRLKVTGETTGF